MVVEKVLSSYYSLGTKAADLVSTTSLRDAHDYLHWFLLDMPVVPGLLVFHALFAAERINLMTGGRQFWFKSYVLTIFGAFGGSTLASIFAGAPPPLFTTASNVMLGYITVAWYVVDQAGPLRMLLRTRPVSAMLAFGATAAKARAIFAFMDQYVVRYPGAIAGAIALGGLSGSGGLLFLSLERKARNGFHTPSELSSPGWAFKSAYLVAATYYLATDPEGILKELPIPLKYSAARDTVRYVLSLALCSHAAAEVLFQRSVNPMYPLERLFYTISRVREVPDGNLAPLEVSSGASSSVQTSVMKSSAVNRNAAGGALRQRAGK